MINNKYLTEGDRFVLAIQMRDAKALNIKSIKEAYLTLRSNIVIYTRMPYYRVDEELIKILVDSLEKPPSDDLKEHILNKG